MASVTALQYDQYVAWRDGLPAPDPNVARITMMMTVPDAEWRAYVAATGAHGGFGGIFDDPSRPPGWQSGIWHWDGSHWYSAEGKTVPDFPPPGSGPVLASVPGGQDKVYPNYSEAILAQRAAEQKPGYPWGMGLLEEDLSMYGPDGRRKIPSVVDQIIGGPGSLPFYFPWETPPPPAPGHEPPGDTDIAPVKLVTGVTVEGARGAGLGVVVAIGLGVLWLLSNRKRR